MAPSPAERTVDAEFLVEFIFEINSKFQSTTSFHKRKLVCRFFWL